MSPDTRGEPSPSASQATEGAATAPHVKIHPRAVRGRFRRLRSAISAILQVILFAGPWLQWHGHQAILLDLPRRRFYLFDLVFWPQELYFVLIIFIFLALTLFVSTAIGGRMWCGYACPQTLLTESFIFVERLLEGDRSRRLKLDQAPWTLRKIAIKATKYAVWLVMSIWLGITLVAYFYGGWDLLAGLAHGTLSTTVGLFIAFWTAVALFDFGWFREQLCHYVCPYARFQGAMFDNDTLVVAYDRTRGEPRGKLSNPEAGHCVDCTMCVQVCPMGIDIRNGLQLECIACTACIDACDAVMDRVKRPRGLVRYTSQSGLEARPAHVARPRVLIYAALLAGLAVLFVTLLAVRGTLQMDVVRDSAGSVFRLTQDKRVMNVYAIKLANKEHRPHTLRIELDGISQAELVLSPQNPVTVPPDSALDLRAIVVRPDGEKIPVQAFRFRATDIQDEAVRLERATTFIGPGGR